MGNTETGGQNFVPVYANVSWILQQTLFKMAICGVMVGLLHCIYIIFELSTVRKSKNVDHCKQVNTKT